MHIHILGICGTFMGGLAILARQLGHEVTGPVCAIEYFGEIGMFLAANLGFF